MKSNDLRRHTSVALDDFSPPERLTLPVLPALIGGLIAVSVASTLLTLAA